MILGALFVIIGYQMNAKFPAVMVALSGALLMIVGAGQFLADENLRHD
jgi:hypothetical protein